MQGARKDGPVVILTLFAALQLVPLLLWGAAYVGSDEALAYLVARGILDHGAPTHSVPFSDVVDGGFSPLTAPSSGDVAAIALSPAYAALVAVFAVGGVAGTLVGVVLLALLLLWSVHRLVAGWLGPTAAFAATAALAAAPPILFFGATLYANLPTLAFLLFGLAMLARAGETRRARHALLGLASLGFATLLRPDAIVLLLPAAVAVLVAARRERVAWGLLAAALALGSVAWVLFAQGVGADLVAALASSGSLPGFARRLAGSALLVLERADSEAFVVNARSFLFGVAPLLCVAGFLGAFLARGMRPRPALVLAGLCAAGLAYAVFYLTWDLRQTLDPPGLNSSLVRYTLLVPVLMAALAGLLVARASAAMGERWRRPFLLVALACLLVPGIVQATWSEPGLRWLAEHRDARSEMAADARRLPPDAILVGDEASVFLFSHPVLVPTYANPNTLTATISELENRSHPHYVHLLTYLGDWSGPVGDFVTDERHYTTPSGVGRFLAVRTTNTTLGRIGMLDEGHWEQDGSGRLVSRMPYSLFAPEPSLAAAMGRAPSPGVLVSFDVWDGDREWHQAGYVNAPMGPNEIRVLHRWLGTGVGGWRHEEMFIPADTIVNGRLFVSEGLAFRALGVEDLGGVVQR